MTLNGAIMQLVQMRESEYMPMMFKPLFDKVIETVSECEEPGTTTVPQWIPVSERLPETDLAHYSPHIGIWHSSDIVLVYCNEPDYISESKYMLAYYDRDEGVDGTRYGWSEATTGDEIEPIAWMPLPEPFKGGD